MLKSNIDVFFVTSFSVLAPVFIVTSNRVSEEVSIVKFVYGLVFMI